MRLDEIKIENLEVYAGHGVFEEENRNGQLFYINATLFTYLAPAGKRDDLSLSTHYGEVSHLIHQVMRAEKYQLIETAAEKVTQEILLHFPLIMEVELELRKPSAPIGLPFESVSVKMRRGWKKAYLGIGSNMGEKQKFIEEAIVALQAEKEIRNVNCSTLIQTLPYGGVEQDDFLNGAIELETLLNPEELLEVLHQIEANAGRERVIHWGPRTLDLDILFYDDVVMHTKNLTIPHVDLQNRTFVLEPLMELCPYYVHPVLKKTVCQLLKELKEIGL